MIGAMDLQKSEITAFINFFYIASNRIYCKI
jgi:hypothetical protein